MNTSALSAAYHARSKSKTPLTDELDSIRSAAVPQYVTWVPHVKCQEIELLLWEARSLLSRIADGAEPVLMEQEIEEFLTKTELS
jgi:hypothetical protein